MPRTSRRRTSSLLLAVAAAVVVSGVSLLALSAADRDPLDPNTPRQQAGFQVIQVSLRERQPSRTALLLRLYLPFLPPAPYARRGMAVKDTLVPANTSLSSREYVLSGQMSDGTRFMPQCSFSIYGNGQETINVQLPEGFPEGVDWVDVRLKDKQSGRAATWRLYDLPRAWHALPPSTPQNGSVTARGVVCEARAWWDENPQASPTGWMSSSATTPLVCEVRGTERMTPDGEPARHAWNMELTNVLTEWADPSRQGKGGSWTGGVAASGENGRYAATGVSDAFLKAGSPVRIDARIREYEPLTEKVTFSGLRLKMRNGVWALDLPKPIRKTTPSGVAVTLGGKPNSNWALPPSAAFRVSADRTATLPDSPLHRRYGKPVSVRLKSVSAGEYAPFQAEYQEDQGAYSSAQPRPKGQPFILRLWDHGQPATATTVDLTFTLEQQAEVRFTPVIFTVPITKGVPKDRWSR